MASQNESGDASNFYSASDMSGGQPWYTAPMVMSSQNPNQAYMQMPPPPPQAPMANTQYNGGVKNKAPLRNGYKPPQNSRPKVV